MSDAIGNLLKVSSSKLTTVVVYPVPEVGCDPYKYNLHHKNITGLELDSLSFPVEEYERRNEFVINAFDGFQQSKGTIIPVRLTAAFCQRHDIEACGDRELCSAVP